MFRENPFVGEAAFATLEVIVMIGGSILLGLLLGYLIWGWTRSKIKEVEEQNSKLNADLEDAEQSLATIQSKLENLLTVQSDLPRESRKVEEVKDELEDSAAKTTEPETSDSPDTLPAEETKQELTEAVVESFHDVAEGDLVGDDFQQIIGIDEEIEALLKSSGITTWAQLANTTKHILRVIIDEGGYDSRAFKPKRWINQADMASKGEWKKLKIYQEVLREKQNM